MRIAAAILRRLCNVDAYIQVMSSCLLVVGILLLFTLCSADSDLQLQVHQLQLHSTVQGEDTWLYASESGCLPPVFYPLPHVPLAACDVISL